MSSIKTPLQRLTEIETEIRLEEAGLPELINRRAAWSQELPSHCNFALKSKRENCQDDRDYKIAKIASIDQQINAKRTRIERLIQERDTINATQDAQNQAAINLSENGQNFEAMVIEAHGNSQANQIKAEIEGQAMLQQAAAESKSNEKDSQAKRNLLLGGGIVLGIIAIAVTVIIIKSRTA
jgi:TolA-binding protein